MESSTDEIPIVMDVQPEGETAMEPIAVIGPKEAAEVSGQRWPSGLQLLVSGAGVICGNLGSSGGIWGHLESSVVIE